jgi:hypothetical protein
MQLDTLLEALCLGELSNLHIGQEALTGDWSNLNRRKVVTYLNAGLKALSSQFELIQREVVLETIPGQSLYYLRREYALSNPTVVAVKYLNDTTCDAFVGDLVRVLEIYDHTAERAVPINQSLDCRTLYMPSWDTIQIPPDVMAAYYSVIYQAAHPTIYNAADLSQELNLPPMMEEALRAYVAWKAYSFMNGDGPSGKGAEFKARYDELCAILEMEDLATTSPGQLNDKVCQNGFV